MTRIVVVGGGIAGAAVAMFLRQRGAEVYVVAAEPAGSTATGASGGTLAPQYECTEPGPLFRALVQCRRFYPEFVRIVREITGEPLHLRWSGMLVANFDHADHGRSERRRAWQRAEGEDAELLEPDAALRRQPGITDAAASYLWLPEEGYVDSQQLAELLPRVLERTGVHLLDNRRVREVEVEDGRICGVQLTDDRVLRADAVVVAAGAWSGALSRLPVRVPVRPVRGHLLRFASGATALDCMVADPGGRFLIPREDGSILAGSSMEEAGFDRSTDADVQRSIHESVRRLVPALAAHQPTDVWADLRPVPHDGLPLVGRDPDAEGLFYATGYGRTGILMAPLAGRIVADQILGDPVPEPWQAFAPRR
jgi:glycine oxidase